MWPCLDSPAEGVGGVGSDSWELLASWGWFTSLPLTLLSTCFMSGTQLPSLSLSLFRFGGLSSGGVLEPKKREGREEEQGQRNEEGESPTHRKINLLLQRSLAAVLTLFPSYEVAVLGCCGDSF